MELFEIIGTTPYSQLTGEQREAIIFNEVSHELIIKVAMEQHPPNESVIAAVHASANVRAIFRHGHPQLEYDRMQKGFADTLETRRAAEQALGSIATSK
jgi:hypothetical protein